MLRALRRTVLSPALQHQPCSLVIRSSRAFFIGPALRPLDWLAGRDVGPTPNSPVLTSRRYIGNKPGTEFTPEMQKRLDILKEAAEKNPQDQVLQHLYLQVLIHKDPCAVKELIEQQPAGMNDDIIRLYVQTLALTGAAGKSKVGATLSLIEKIKTFFKTPKPELGSKENPFHTNIQWSWWALVLNNAASIIFYSIVIYFAWDLFFNLKNASERKAEKVVVEKPSVTFDDIRGCDEAKNELVEIVEFLKNPNKYKDLGGKLTKGVLLSGPPGTGKTMLAKAVAGEAGVPFLYQSGSSFDEMLVGMGASRMRSLFDTAKKVAPSIIFIDELDAVGSVRSKIDISGNRQTLNQLLVEMDGFASSCNVVVMAATNVPDNLDKALLRPGRFDLKVDVDLPDVKGRESIFSLYLSRTVCSSDVDVTALAKTTPGVTGAEIEVMVNQAILHACNLGSKEVTMDHLEWSKDKVLHGIARTNRVMDKETLSATAVHECGHALVAWFTKDADPLYKITILPRGRSLGMTMSLPSSEVSTSRKQILSRIDIALGGRAAEEIILGPSNLTVGCASDLETATRLAYQLVAVFGMSDEIGLMQAPESKHSSPELKARIEHEVQTILKESYKRASDILRNHIDDLHVVKEALLQRETLSSEDMRILLESNKKPITNGTS